MTSQEENLKLLQKGSLEWTAEDYVNVGTPPDILRQNPGKTQAELMSDDQIKEYLREQDESLAQLSPEVTAYKHLKKNLELSKQYLKGIGRFPKEFDEAPPQK